MARYARLFLTQLRASALLAMQYRGDFLLDGGLSVFRTLSALVPLFVVYHGRSEVMGWSFGQALLVTGWFTLLRGIIEGAISPSLEAVVDHIRKGTLDFVLLKPADAQFLVSTTRFELWPISRVVTALAIFAYAFFLLGKPPPVVGTLAALLLVGSSTLILYSLWILTVSAAFYVVKVDNLIYLFDSVFDVARWPSTIFKGFLEIVFTFLIPMAVMTTYPAQAMLGMLSVRAFLGATAGSLVFAAVARGVWLRSIGRYTSASS